MWPPEMTPEMHLAMMRDPMRWPQVVLPVKRGDYMRTLTD